MSNQPPKNPPAASAPSAGHAARHDDDLIVPKGISRGQFLFLVGLMIFLMVIWLVPGAMFGIAGGGPRDQVIARFQLPSGGQVEYHSIDLFNAQASIRDAVTVDRFLSIQLGSDLSKPEPRELVRLMVMDELARDTGVEISDTDLAGYLRETLQFQGMTPDDFKAIVRAQGFDQGSIENTIRMLLRISRFQQLVGFAGALPDPARIEELWKEENVEFAFDYVSVAAGDMLAEARAELPDDAGLEAWFTALDAAAQAEFKTAEKRTAELALFRDAETTPAAELLAAFPEPVAAGVAPTAPEELANQYYNRVFPRRFAKPAGADDTPAGFFTFEEVREACLVEAPVYFALQRWLADLNARRTNGESLDFAAEAQKYGLDHQVFLEPLAREDFGALPELGDGDVVSAIFATAPDGSLYASPLALSSGLVVVRVNSRTEPELPPFATIRDKVAEKWVEPKAEELARARLVALRATLERFEPPVPADAPPQPKTKKVRYRASAEAFRAAAEGAGLAVRTRDYLNRAGPANLDPQWEDEDHKTLFAQASGFGLYALEPDEVSEAGVSFDQQRVYLVRLAGKRDVPLANMSPTQYERYKQMARGRAMGEVAQNLDLEFLKQSVGLWLYEDSPEARAEREKLERERSEKAAAKASG